MDTFHPFSVALLNYRRVSSLDPFFMSVFVSRVRARCGRCVAFAGTFSAIRSFFLLLGKPPMADPLVTCKLLENHETPQTQWRFVAGKIIDEGFSLSLV